MNRREFFKGLAAAVTVAHLDPRVAISKAPDVLDGFQVRYATGDYGNAVAAIITCPVRNIRWVAEFRRDAPPEKRQAAVRELASKLA